MTSELKIGDQIKDNDPRMPNRVLKITLICGTESVKAKSFAGPEVRISTKRIFTDGKVRRSGFDLVVSGSETGK